MGGAVPWGSQRAGVLYDFSWSTRPFAVYIGQKLFSHAAPEFAGLCACRSATFGVGFFNADPLGGLADRRHGAIGAGRTAGALMLTMGPDGRRYLGVAVTARRMPPFGIVAGAREFFRCRPAGPGPGCSAKRSGPSTRRCCSNARRRGTARAYLHEAGSLRKPGDEFAISWPPVGGVVRGAVLRAREATRRLGAGGCVFFAWAWGGGGDHRAGRGCYIRRRLGPRP